MLTPLEKHILLHPSSSVEIGRRALGEAIRPENSLNASGLLLFATIPGFGSSRRCVRALILSEGIFLIDAQTTGVRVLDLPKSETRFECGRGRPDQLSGPASCQPVRRTKRLNSPVIASLIDRGLSTSPGILECRWHWALQSNLSVGPDGVAEISSVTWSVSQRGLMSAKYWQRLERGGFVLEGF